MSVQSVLFVHLAFLYGPSPHDPGSLCGAGSPCTHPQALRPAPREFMRSWELLRLLMQALRESMAKPCSAPRVTFSPMRKSPKNLPEGYPLWVLPLGGIIIPPAARRAAPPRRTLHGELGAN